ncbi:MAG: hypothetical protein EWV88_12180 [Microcystis wesenbergii Mw_MB_S_20031200_S109D]|uniref:Uncharacterized protein n=1 Tax=Microcystis wesenbergii Mw_MB_S_20031200_S109D TaxID=2486241 RepID=A0A552LSK1_9CHRO|nr:MAG: hypothetical protein EWV88_12180 [Microcystis wesenbergii Mw_MB_S_20031200_S109D]
MFVHTHHGEFVQCVTPIRYETLIEKDIWRFLSIVFDPERTNQLNLLPDKDLVDLCSLSKHNK